MPDWWQITILEVVRTLSRQNEMLIMTQQLWQRIVRISRLSLQTTGTENFSPSMIWNKFNRRMSQLINHQRFRLSCNRASNPTLHVLWINIMSCAFYIFAKEVCDSSPSFLPWLISLDITAIWQFTE